MSYKSGERRALLGDLYWGKWIGIELQMLCWGAHEGQGSDRGLTWSQWSVVQGTIPGMWYLPSHPWCGITILGPSWWEGKATGRQPERQRQWRAGILQAVTNTRQTQLKLRCLTYTLHFFPPRFFLDKYPSNCHKICLVLLKIFIWNTVAPPGGKMWAAHLTVLNSIFF